MNIFSLLPFKDAARIANVNYEAWASIFLDPMCRDVPKASGAAPESQHCSHVLQTLPTCVCNFHAWMYCMYVFLQYPHVNTYSRWRKHRNRHGRHGRMVPGALNTSGCSTLRYANQKAIQGSSPNKVSQAYDELLMLRIVSTGLTSKC